MERKENSREYQRGKNRLFFAGLCLNTVFLSLVFFSGLSFLLRDYASSITSGPLLLNGIYLFVFSVLFFIFHLPLTYYVDYIWEHKFDLSVQKRGQWLFDEVKRSALGFIILLALFETVYVLLGRCPNSWWIWAGAVWLCISFILAKLTPAVLVPMFYKYTPVKNDGLRQDISRMFKDCGIPLDDVYAIDLSRKTKKANAFLCGVGRSRRVVLSDTLLEQFSNGEIKAVVAHELGHYKNKDIVKLLAVNAATVMAGFYLIDKLLNNVLVLFGMTRIDDIAFFPMIILAFIMFGLLTTPVLNAYSRKLERAADRFSLESSGDPEAFISMMRKLGGMNLADFFPSRFVELFFYDHPPVGKRIAFAEKMLNP